MSPLSRARIPGTVLGVVALSAATAPVWLVPACTETISECFPMDCVAYCGGPVVTHAEDCCPEGLLPDRPVRTCVDRCYDNAVTATTCDSCPADMFDPSLCDELGCTTGGIVCLDHCGGQFMELVCDVCSPGEVDKSTCLDAGADG